jgi:uncharacterized protein
MPLLRRLLVFPALALGLASALLAERPRTATLVINEVDADQVSTDAAEFVEIYDGGAGATALDGYVLVLFNGSNDLSYLAFDLDGKATDANGYFVLCGDAANVPSCDLDVTPNTDLVQNGADAVALYAANGSDFPLNTPVTVANLVDALVYDTSDPDDAGLLVLLNAGQPQVDENANAAGTTESNQRCPNGSGGARNTTSYDQYPPTAGAVNDCGGPATPTLTVANASVAEGDAGTTNFVFTVTVNPAAAGTVTFDIATQDGTATDADNDYEPNSATGQTIVPPATTFQFTVQVNGDTTAEPDESFTVVVSNLTGADPGDLTATGTITNDEIVITPIHTLQGSGASSPYAGQPVTTRGIVTGVRSTGFFLQAKEADADADPATSEGILVFTSTAPPAAAAVGNEVEVSGTITEYVPSADPQQPPLTELAGTVGVVQLSTGNPLPAPVPLTTSFPTPAGAHDQLERLEGMRVSVASLTVVGPTLGNLTEATGATTSTGVFYGVVAGTDRPLREAGVQQPDDLAVLLGGTPPANIPRFDGNPERIRVDSDGLVGGALLDVRAGQTVAGLIGPLDYTFRTYTILPDAGAVLVPSGTVTPGAASSPAAGEVTVGSYNMERFYDTVDDPATSDVALSPAWYAARMDKASKHIREYLHAPDVLAVVEVENNTTLLDLAGRISVDAVAAGQPDPQYNAYLIEGNDIGGIDVGFLVLTRPLAGTLPRVEVIDLVQEGKTTTWIDPSTGSPALLNDRPPLRLRARVHSANGSEFGLTVVVVHQRSLNGISSTEPSGSTTAGNRVRQKRRAQSEYLANLLQARQVADAAERIVVVGDFNAFEDNDGFVDVMGTIQGTPAPADQVAVASADLVNPDFVRLSDADDYSFVFDGNAQNLDHAIVNAPLVAATTARRLDHARVNADFHESDRATTDARLADHDPLVAYFEVAAFADPGALFRDDFERGGFARWSGVIPAP